jgi:hypothetical protein
MGTSLQIALVTAVVLVLVVLLALLLRSRAESRRALAAASAETDELRRRLDALAEQLELAAEADRARAAEAAYVITDAGETRPEPTVPDRVVLSATVGEPLVKAVSFGHGVRRALSAESRNRIWFEMRREVRASRRRRRREMKEFVRRARAADRASEDTAAA